MEWLCYFVLLLPLRPSLQNELPIVNTELGMVRGHYKISYDNRLFAAFEGIPYANPPIDDLRFAEPESVHPWTGILDATILHECAQHIKPDSADENEDCLYLNVYVPRKEPISHENLDVIVHIHGGAFMMGGPAFAGPEYLMDRDIVYVTFSYRLGVFGFLSTGDDVVPGNMGLKDQVLALKWIKSNIEHFGGNPNSVTIVGVSAGAACVHLHYFSNLSKELFHRGVSHSGTALGPWAIHNNPLENALKLAETVDCPRSKVRDVVKCLKTKTAKELSIATFSTYNFFGFPVAPFAPVVEKLSNTAFLTEHPYELLQKGNIVDVPWISSATSDEGLLIFFFLKDIKEIINNFDKSLPNILNYFDNVAEVNKSDVTKKIIKHFFEDSSNVDKDIIKIVGDRLFKIPMEKSVEMQAKVSKSSIYSYIYAYENDVQFPDIYNITYKGTNHASDGVLIYGAIFRLIEDNRLSKNDEWMKTFLMNIVTTFAKDGIPKTNKIKWEPVTQSNDWGYLHIIDKNHIAMSYEKANKTMEFWDSLAIDYWTRKQKIRDEF